MQCNQESLQIYLDGEMDTLARKAVEAHLGPVPFLSSGNCSFTASVAGVRSNQ